MDTERTESDGVSTANGTPDDGPAVTGSGRAIQACDRCRMKKVRCDGLLPTCGRCRVAGLECQTMVKLTRKSYPRSYTESIEERLRDVEGEVQRLKAENAAKATRISELEAAARARPALHASPQPAEPRVPGETVSGRRDNRALSWRSAGDGDDSVCREVGRMNSDRRGVGRYVGASSGIFFVGLAQQRFAALSSSIPLQVGHELLRVETDDHSVAYRIHPPHHGLRDDFHQALPSYATAVACCDAWFEFWRFIFPILHRPTFTRNLELMYFKAQTAPDADVPAEIFAIFYLVLALGSRQMRLSGGDGAAGGDDDGVVYFEKAMSYYDDVTQLGTLRTVQFQELLALWYVATGKRSLALQTTGSVAKLALELGLHRASDRFNFNALTTEVRKRTFWVCYILDCFLSAMAGLPRALRDADITADPPSAVSDALVSAAGYLPSLPGEPSGMRAFVALVAAARIAARALELLYTTTTRRGTAAKIRLLDAQLDAWAAALPTHLQIDFTELARMSRDEARADLGEGAPEVVFAHLVHLHARLLVHRPALSFEPRTAQSRASLLRCVEVSRQALCLLDCFGEFVLLFDINPGAHVYTIWQCGLVALYGVLELGDAAAEFEAEARGAAQTCLGILEYMVARGRDGEAVRAQNLRHILAAMPPPTPSEPTPAATETAIGNSLASAPLHPAQLPISPLARFLGTPATASGSTSVSSPLAFVGQVPPGFPAASAHPYAPTDIWDDPVFAPASAPPAQSPQTTQSLQSPAVVGSSELYDAEPGAKRMRFAEPS